MKPYGVNILLNTEIKHIIYQIVIFINKSVFVMWKNNNRWVEINIKLMEKDLNKRTIVLILKKFYFDNDDALPFWDPALKMKQKWYFSE